MLLPSAIQRSEDFVGMEMPMVPLLSAAVTGGASHIRPAASAANAILYVFIILIVLWVCELRVLIRRHGFRHVRAVKAIGEQLST